MVAAGAALAMALKSYSTLAAVAPKTDRGTGRIRGRRRSSRDWVLRPALWFIVGVAGAWAVLSRPELPEIKVVSPALPSAPPEQLARAWPSFRGFAGDGVVPAGLMPQDWDGAAGKGIVWKSPVPLPGHGSPVVFGGLVFSCRIGWNHSGSFTRLMWARGS